MTNQTLERAARAVALVRGWDESYADEHDAERYHRENGPAAYVDEARAVLMAVREPDEAMVKAATDLEEEIIGTYGCVEPTGAFQPNGPKLCFTAMIDSILSDGDAA